MKRNILTTLALVVCLCGINIYADSNAKEYIDSAVVKCVNGDYEGALKDCDKAIELDPKNANIYSNRGFAKGALADYKGAIEDYTKAIELDPKSENAYYNRGFTKCNLDDYTGAVEDCTKAIVLNPKYMQKLTIGEGIVRVA